MVLATLIGIVAGYFRGFVDGVLARVLDLHLGLSRSCCSAIALGTSLALGGLNLGLLHSCRATRCWCRR